MNIQVTLANRPSLFRTLCVYLKILRSRVYTNDGPNVKELEKILAQNLGFKHVVLMANGTMPIQFLMSRLPDNSKVLTTPFSFVATSSAIVESRLKPVFIDIDESLLIDPELVLSKIDDEQVSAILLTFVYGKSEGIEDIIKVAKTFDKPVYVDASHSFSLQPTLGDIPYCEAFTMSFHATKVFSTIEGGAILTNHDTLAFEAKKWRNFGIDNGKIEGVGINGKMSEFHAAFGVKLFGDMARELERRKKLAANYEKMIRNTQIELVKSPSFSYFPILFKSEDLLVVCVKKLNEIGIFPRRYFYPSLDTIFQQKGLSTETCPVSNDVSSRVLCLPFGKDVRFKHVKRITQVLNETN